MLSLPMFRYFIVVLIGFFDFISKFMSLAVLEPELHIHLDVNVGLCKAMMLFTKDYFSVGCNYCHAKNTFCTLISESFLGLNVCRYPRSKAVAFIDPA